MVQALQHALEPAVQARGNETANRVLDGAETFFVTRNYADVSVTEVAAAARVTKGAVYHHFRSKAGLYLGMLYRDLERKRCLFQREGVEFAGPAPQRLRRLTAAFLALPEAKQRLLGLVRRDINLFTGTVRSGLVHAYQEALPVPVETIIRDGISDGELETADARLLAWQFIALVEVVLAPYARRCFERDEGRLDHVMRLFLNGCAPRRPGEAP